MFVLITYDVNTTTYNGKVRLRHVSKECEKYGQRVQCSVFECVLSPAQLIELKHRLATIISHSEDSVRFYLLGDNYQSHIEFLGNKGIITSNEDIIL